MKRFMSRLAVAVGVTVLIAALVLAAFPAATNAAAQIDSSRDVSAAPAPAWFGCTYVVRFGDTLFRIGLRFGVSPFALAFANGIPNPNFIFAGMVLRVPCPNVPPPNVPPPPTVCAIYIVQRGDWLITIAARFGTTWQAIAAANHLANPNLIFVGMRLVIPCPGAQQPPPTAFCQPGAASGAIMIRMQNIAFNPHTCMIHKGQTVIWQNFDAVQHSATQGTCTATTCTATSGGFNTGLMNPGANVPITFNTTGTFHYYCMVHTVAMQGDIVVVP